MCEECGCDSTKMVHTHNHESGDLRTITLERRILAHNHEHAEANRKFLASKKIVALNIISSPGSGKTALLEATLKQLKNKVRCAVITGDPQTDNDARRLRGNGARVVQILTGNSCHLDAAQVGARLEQVCEDSPKLVFIENVGNLLCPVAFDLGEKQKVALLSVTEGEDKPLKYPSLFSAAKVAVVTKIDLIPHLDFDLSACFDNILAVKPTARIIALCAKTGEGMEKWIKFLEELSEETIGER